MWFCNDKSENFKFLKKFKRLKEYLCTSLTLYPVRCVDVVVYLPNNAQLQVHI